MRLGGRGLCLSADNLDFGRIEKVRCGQRSTQRRHVGRRTAYQELGGQVDGGWVDKRLVACSITEAGVSVSGAGLAKVVPPCAACRCVSRGLAAAWCFQRRSRVPCTFTTMGVSIPLNRNAASTRSVPDGSALSVITA